MSTRRRWKVPKMLNTLIQYLKQPETKPEGWKPYAESSLIGRQPGRLHLRYDYPAVPRWQFLAFAILETFMLLFVAIAEGLTLLVLWLARLVPDAMKWSAVVIVGLSIAIAIAVFGVAIGIGLLADLSYTELMNFAAYVLEGERE